MLPPMLNISTLRVMWTLFSLLACGHAFAQENLNPINPLPGVKTWRWSEDGISVRLTQIVPEQVRGFYMGRGFSQSDAELIAGDCIFQTVIRNDSRSDKVQVDLRRWRVAAGPDSLRPKTREDWGELWRERNSATAARLAFRWALFPTVQEFDHGDWNMGMSSYGLAPGTRFNLELSFTVGEQTLRGQIKSIECAEDALPE